MDDEISIKLSRKVAEALAAQLGATCEKDKAATLMDPPGESIYGIKLLTKDLKSIWAGRFGYCGTQTQYGREWQYVNGCGCYVDTGVGASLVSAGSGTEDHVLVLMECRGPNPETPSTYFYVRIVAVQGVDWEQKHTDLIPRRARDRIRKHWWNRANLTPEQYHLIVHGPESIKTYTSGKVAETSLTQIKATSAEKPLKTCTKVVRPNKDAIGRTVKARNDTFRAFCCLYPPYLVTVAFSRFPGIWRGKDAVVTDTPLFVLSSTCPALGVSELYLPGSDRRYDAAPAFHVFDTSEEASTFYYEKLLPTLRALAQLADETLIVESE